MKNEIIKILEESKTEIKTDTWYGEVIEDHNFDLIAEKLVKLFCQHDVSKRKFAVEWVRNVNYGIGSGTEYFDAETREEALKLFWNGKNKEAFEVNTIYVC